jgi:hypothetical protein
MDLLTNSPILSFQPHLVVKEKLLVEYDEDGNLILSDEEDDLMTPQQKIVCSLCCEKKKLFVMDTHTIYFY